MQATVPVGAILDQKTLLSQAQPAVDVDAWELCGWWGNQYPQSPRSILGLTSTSDESTIGVYYYRFMARHRETGRIIEGELAHGTFVSRDARNATAEAAVKAQQWEPRIELAGKLLVRGGGR